jgi:hypothetical protein
MAEDRPPRDPDVASDQAAEAWAAAAAALARGDLDGFAAEAGVAARAAGAGGDVVAARALAAARDRLLAGPSLEGGPVEMFAAALAELAAGRSDPGLGWRHLNALAAELPPLHPLLTAAAELGWDAIDRDVVLAVLALGDLATVESVAILGGHTLHGVEARLPELIASGAIEAGHGARLAASAVLAAACAHTVSPLALQGTPSPAGAALGLAEVLASAGVVVVVAPTLELARAGVRVAEVVALDVGPPSGDGRALGWAVRDARWREATLVVEVSTAADAARLTSLGGAGRALVLTGDDEVAAAAVLALSSRRADVLAWRLPSVPPSIAAPSLASAFGVAPAVVRVGHLHVGDLEALVTAIESRGEVAVWDLETELRRRAAEALAPFVFTDAPPLPPGAVERARERLEAGGAWGARVAALAVALPLATPVALALASQRRVVAATLALGGDAPGPRMTAALAAARRWGAVLAIGIERADPVVITAFARRLVASDVLAVIGVRPGAQLPPALAAITSTLAI